MVFGGTESSPGIKIEKKSCKRKLSDVCLFTFVPVQYQCNLPSSVCGLLVGGLFLRLFPEGTGIL